jgi:hypothetical protein
VYKKLSTNKTEKKTKDIKMDLARKYERLPDALPKNQLSIRCACFRNFKTTQSLSAKGLWVWRSKSAIAILTRVCSY